MLEKAIDESKNIILSKVGDNVEKLKDTLIKFQKLGYKTTVMLADLPPQQSLVRAFHRFLKNGRYVAYDYILNEVGLKPKETYGILKREPGYADAFIAYDVDVPYGRKAKLIEGGEYAEARKPSKQKIQADEGQRRRGPERRPRPGPGKKAPQTIRQAVRRHGKISLKKAQSAGYTYQDFKEWGLLNLLSSKGRGVDELAEELAGEGCPCRCLQRWIYQPGAGQDEHVSADVLFG